MLLISAVHLLYMKFRTNLTTIMRTCESLLLTFLDLRR